MVSLVWSMRLVCSKLWLLSPAPQNSSNSKLGWRRMLLVAEKQVRAAPDRTLGSVASLTGNQSFYLTQVLRNLNFDLHTWHLSRIQ